MHSTFAQPVINTEVLVIGGGTGGTAAGIQAARLGAKTIIIEPTVWLGGMISAAGVTATDGNHKLPSGLWNEFRNHLYKVYGGPKAVETGWVSNTLFEPHVEDSIFKVMAGAEKKLTVKYQWNFDKVLMKRNRVSGAVFKNNKNEKLQINATVVIDATELADVMAAAKTPYSLGMEAAALTGEKVGIAASNNIIQDLTYVAILKDYGPAADCTIVKPPGYNATEFDGACTDYYIDKNIIAPTIDAKKMLDYGRLPNNKYMLNWPARGNDTYLSVVEMKPAKRDKELQKAKQATLRFVYFIQQQLGFKNLGLTYDEFPTKDRLALIPYHREGRRVRGLVRFDLNHLAAPFTSAMPLYRTGISVGDYPIDHHHKKNAAAPQHLEFYPVPSYNIPLGALIPQTTDGLIMAEKGISVSNVVNGTTRLQPCVLLTGQAAGTLAALSVIENRQPRLIAVRNVQKTLLNSGAYIMPYIDMPFNNPHFLAIQKIGATGILRGTGIPYKWANQTWFYPDSVINTKLFVQDFNEYSTLNYRVENELLTINDLYSIITMQLLPVTNNRTFSADVFKKSWNDAGLTNFDVARTVKRFEAAVMIDKWLQPFESKQVDHEGFFKN